MTHEKNFDAASQFTLTNQTLLLILNLNNGRVFFVENIEKLIIL